MKVHELFLERMLAPVHVKGDLTVLPGLLQKEFGLHFRDLGGACLASQFVFTLSDISGISPQELADAVNVSGGFLGVSFEKLFNEFDGKVLKLKNKKVKFNLSLETHNMEEAMAQVQQGQPVTTIISGALGGDINDTGPDGIFKAIRPYHALDRTNAFHALLLIGFDNQEKTLVFREMRSRYAFSGYVKIPMAAVKKNKGHFKFISTIVDDFKEVK